MSEDDSPHDVIEVSGQAVSALGRLRRAAQLPGAVVFTPGTRHNVVNDGREPLRIYTVYAPPNHVDGQPLR